MKKSGNSRRARLAVVLGALCALGLALSLQAAIAHKVTYDSSLQLKDDTLTDTTTQYSGSVNSTRATCEVGRPVTVLANGAVIATATTVIGGAWSASGPAQVKGTSLIATIPRKVLSRNKRHRHKCAPASATRRAK